MTGGIPGWVEWEWDVPADLMRVDEICEEFRKIGAVAEMASEDRFAGELLLREAVNNAIIHGCREDSSRRIRCQIGLSEDEFRVVVTDDGPGFDWRAAQARLAEDEATQGRGLLILSLYCNSFTFSETGNRVVLIRKLRVRQGK